jgi:hypothetical protein
MSDALNACLLKLACRDPILLARHLHPVLNKLAYKNTSAPHDLEHAMQCCWVVLSATQHSAYPPLAITL